MIELNLKPYNFPPSTKEASIENDRPRKQALPGFDFSFSGSIKFQFNSRVSSRTTVKAFMHREYERAHPFVSSSWDKTPERWLSYSNERKNSFTRAIRKRNHFKARI
jgi:hypothetical protein